MQSRQPPGAPKEVNMLESIGAYGGYMNGLNSAQKMRPKGPGFDKIDQNDDGNVDKTELLTFTDSLAEKTGKTLDADKMFARLDINEDNLIDKEEFRLGRRRTNRPDGPGKGGGMHANKPNPFSDLLLDMINEDPDSSETTTAATYQLGSLSNSLLQNYTNNSTDFRNNPLSLLA